MYNGIGLDTARGSGTNGYVQRNLSFIRRHKDKVDYKSEEELKKLDAQITKGPNKDILDHERKRKVELKCMEMQELMEEQGYDDEEIELKVSTFRQMLMDKVQETNTGVVEKDESGRPVAKATHQLAEANQARNDQLKAAFGLSEFYKEGSSMDPQRKAKEEAAKALALAQKKYAILPNEEDAEAEKQDSSSGNEKRKHKQSAQETQSDHGTQNKKKKQKREQSLSPSSDKKKNRKISSDEEDHHHLTSNNERHKQKPSEIDTQQKRKKKHRHEQSASPSPDRRKQHHKSPERSSDRHKSHKNELLREKKGKHRSDRSRSSSVSHKKKHASSRSRSNSVENRRRKLTKSSPDVARDRKSSKKSRK